MPLLSVIVPVHNLGSYVRDCLRSVVGQGFSDYELIVVDDASTDGSGEITASLVRGLPQARVVTLPVNVGLGGARNRGLEEARGDYVLFVDGDDWLAEGAMRAIAQHLSTTRCDVLVFDHVRIGRKGRPRPNPNHEMLRAAPAGAFPLRQYPQLLRLLQVSCNKAYRRSFLDELGIRFPPGYYEDLPWTFPILMSTERIAVLPKVCYCYRQARPERILQTTSRRHFDVFDQYERLFAYTSRDGLEEWRPLLWARMAEHLDNIMRERTNRLPRDARSEFFHRASEAYRRHRPRSSSAVPDIGAGPPATVGRLLAWDLYSGYWLYRSWRMLAGR